MLRKLKTGLFIGHEFSACSLPFTHVPVRHRKPPWLGTAPSKKFRIPVRVKLPDLENKELTRLTNNYKCYFKAIHAYHIEVNARKSATDPEVIDQQKKLEREDWDTSNFLNDEWNAQVAAEREQRKAKEKEEKILRILAAKEAQELKEKEELDKAEEIVQSEIAKSKEYITRENIDEHIEKALSNVVDFNYAIDKDGNVYSGRRTSPLNCVELDKQAVEN